ncbi:uncharacterized protein A1O9_03039 [Exophiala aquamarina CBS 119918]|uniref:Transcriptional regulatory protein n=1 Tax=Exophiala aquamarina CBS 119918 TaxID=1182545 RepID=A0A072PQ54_9EURO|nr:uncharacterized protein A1O9_03039 [Exophiala aquamarina CBS 119918]KEF61473.1 hypothetical protein A1O9_03039 [Exophiala aquamarina CBS 119918]
MGLTLILGIRAAPRSCLGRCRHFSSLSFRASGHNRWSKIKHDKGVNDLQKARERTRLSQQISLASKLHGPDPNANPHLASAIAAAKKGQLAKDMIEVAILRGQGKSLANLPLEAVIIEALLPHGVAAVVECETDNKRRTLQDIRVIINKAGGTVGPTSFLFEKKGRIHFEEQDKIGVDEALEAAIDAGALDIVEEESRLVVETPPTELTAIAERLQETLKIRMEKSEVVYVPNDDTMVPLTDEQAGELQPVLDALEADPSCQALYINGSFD